MNSITSNESRLSEQVADREHRTIDRGLIAIDSELRSLFALLDDPDPRVAEAVTERIRKRGEDVIPPLLHFMESTSEPLARVRAETITSEFTTARLTRELVAINLRLERNDPSAFEEGVFLIAKFGNPMLDVSELRSDLDDFAETLRYRTAGLSSALEVLDEVNHFFFEDLRFRGNHAKFLDPANSYIDKVIERRMGIPISLAAVYLLVTKSRLSLPFSGASAPGHFLIRYDGLRSEPLYIDAFNGGILLRERDIKHYLDGSGLPFHKQFLDPTHPRQILLRMVRNLIIAFTELGNAPARAAFEGFMRVLAPNAPEGQAFLRGLEG